jgi:S-adenosylmethionine/arginine decarboxylase-like enzyme
MGKYWGYHFHLDASGCDPKAIKTRKVIKNFITELVPAIDMIPYKDPKIVKFGTDDKAGYTLVQLIETSNICAHFVDETNAVYLDVFSCKEYDPQIVEDLVVKYFGAQKFNKFFMHRQAPE